MLQICYLIKLCNIVTVQRKYESSRKQWLDAQKQNYHDIMEEREKKKKYRSRRQRVIITLSFTIHDIHIASCLQPSNPHNIMHANEYCFRNLICVKV